MEADQVLARFRRTLHRPGLLRRLDLAHLDLERLHHLADITVGQDECRIAIVVGKIEGQHGEVEHLLHRSRRQHDVAVAAMAAALDDAEVVALLRSDVAQAGTAAHHVDDHAGNSAPAI